MKRYFLFFMISLISPITLFSQEKIPCTVCGGSGGSWLSIGYVPCFSCGGTGKIVNPAYMNQRAYNSGMAEAAFMRGKIDLSHRDYDSAFKFFKKAVDNDLKEAIYYLGICLELGYGITVSHDLAKEMYDIGSKMGVKNCIEAVARINKEGFYPATDDMREKFRVAVKNMLAFQLGVNDVSIPSSGSSRGSSSSSGRTCPGCNGTGVGGEKIIYGAEYTSGSNFYCPKCSRTSPHTHHTPICPVCHGRKTLR